MNNYEKYLPVGTVVMLKGGSKKVMIIGFCSSTEEDSGKVYDYTGCLYPEGMLSSTQALLFDHNQIDKIYHIGFRDEEEVKFKEKLKSVVAEMNNEEVVDIIE